MKAVAVVHDLIIGSRIAEAARRATAELRLAGDVNALPPVAEVDLLLVDWSERQPDWGDRLRTWRSSSGDAHLTVVLFGPHTDLAAHAAARESGLGPMMARSKLVADLDRLLKDQPGEGAQRLRINEQGHVVSRFIDVDPDQR